jgi:hypothetical protein
MMPPSFFSDLKNNPGITMKLFFQCAIFLVMSSVYGQGKVLYQENFDKYKNKTDITELGWRVVSKPGRSTYTVKDGKLYITITPHKFKDGYAEIAIPVCRKGQIDFDALIDPDRSKENGIGMTLDLYNISTFWHDYCKDWRLYSPEPTAKRMEGFKVEPVGHQAIGKVKKHKWMHYRICFDTDKDRVECYVDDMKDPAYIKGDAAVLGRDEYYGGKLRLGSFGICSGSYQTVIDNIVIRSFDTTQKSGSKAKSNLYLLFRGISFNYYRIRPALLASGVKPANIRNYDLDCWRSSYMAENPIKYNKLPGSVSFERAKSIVMIDAPCGPKKILPDFLQKDILGRIHKGAKLVILGGLFTLGKGEFQGTRLGQVLPVKLAGAWQIKKAAKPLQITPSCPEYKKIDWSAKPCVYYYHDLKPIKGAKVLLKAGDKPLLVSRKYGKGEIIVFLGSCCGKPDNNSLPFWKWAKWQNLITKVIM